MMREHAGGHRGAGRVMREHAEGLEVGSWEHTCAGGGGGGGAEWKWGWDRVGIKWSGVKGSGGCKGRGGEGTPSTVRCGVVWCGVV